MSEISTTEVASDDFVGFRVRLKFKMAKFFHDDRPSLEVLVNGTPVTVTPAWGEKSLKDSPWIAMTAAGFSTPEDALAFGQHLKLTVQLVAARHRIGADCGSDKASSGMGDVYRKEIFKQSGVWMRNSVHGVDVFENHKNVRFVGGLAIGRVQVSPSHFMEAVQKYHLSANTLSPTARDILLLLNFALMTSEPVAQTVIVISAVEMIGQDLEWNQAQKDAIERLRLQVSRDESLTAEEAAEVAGAIEKGLHKVSLRQGVKRLLNKLGLAHLMKDWDKIYGERSSLVHGLAPEPGKAYDSLASKAVTLCGHILLTALAKELDSVDDNLCDHYPLHAIRA